MITSLYASLLAILFLILSIHVIKARRHYQVALGHSQEDELQKRIRAQGNFIEYTPLFLIMLLLAELNQLYTIAIHTFGIAFLLGRILHSYGLTRQEVYEEGKLVKGGSLRVRGMQTTFGCLGLLAIILSIQYIWIHLRSII